MVGVKNRGELGRIGEGRMRREEREGEDRREKRRNYFGNKKKPIVSFPPLLFP